MDAHILLPALVAWLLVVLALGLLSTSSICTPSGAWLGIV